MRAMEGTVQEGSIPTWMEVVFVKTILIKRWTFNKEPNYQMISGKLSNLQVFSNLDRSGSIEFSNN